MTKREIRKALKELSKKEREDLLSEFLEEASTEPTTLSRRDYLNNKRGHCPHCKSRHYIKFGMDKGSQRYRCKDCMKTFTEYTGTFMSGLHHKDLVSGYLELMEQELSLDKIVERLGINKKTAFDWRHKILSAFGELKKGSFKGVTESDDMFLPFSEKGSQQLERKARKRGGALKVGITDDKVAVIVTTDRG